MALEEQMKVMFVVELNRIAGFMGTSPRSGFLITEMCVRNIRNQRVTSEVKQLFLAEIVFRSSDGNYSKLLSEWN